MSAGCSAPQDGWPGDGAFNRICRCAGILPRPHHSSGLTLSSQLHFSLNDATQWVSHYNGFNYEEFYEFVIDAIEEDQTPEGKAAMNDLFDWWNQYAPIFNTSLHY